MKISQKYKDTNSIYTFNKKEQWKSMNFVLASPMVSERQFSKQVGCSQFISSAQNSHFFEVLKW